MRLINIESKQLLPRFASKIAWVMNALDSLIKTTVQRVKSIDAPLTMEAIEACTDEELEALYEQYGVAQYYPDLSRQTRNKMLYEMCRIYRYLGTPKAIETLCNYIFDGVQLNVKVFDNLAFDEDGTLVDESLLDVFDIEVNPTEPIFGADVNARILANIIRFSRNSQALRNIIYTFIQDFSISVSPCKRTGNPQVTQTWPQDSLCVPYTPPTPSFPTVTKNHYYPSTSGYVNTASGGTMDVYTRNPTAAVLYDDNHVYVVYGDVIDSYYGGSAGGTHRGVFYGALKDQGLLVAKNITNSTRSYITDLYVAVCLSNNVSVCIVYNSSSNKAFYALKYLAGLTAYYFVLDGPQNEWVDSLESIGYKLDEDRLYTTKSKGSTNINNLTQPFYGYNELFETVDYDTSKTYTITGVYKADGTKITYLYIGSVRHDAESVIYFTNKSGKIGIRATGYVYANSTGTTISISYVTYTAS